MDVKTLSFYGLGSGAESAHKAYPKLLQFLLPSVAARTGRKLEIVRGDIRGPKLVSQAWVQGECRFDGKGLKCEIRLYEGLFLALRCILEILHTQAPLAKEGISFADFFADQNSWLQAHKKIGSSEALAFLSATMERFWRRPDDPLGQIEFFTHKGHSPSDIKLGEDSPIATILVFLDSRLDDKQRKQCELGVHTATLFILAHELGHYVIRATKDASELAAMAEAVRSVFKDYAPPGPKWAEDWSEELMADFEAIQILTDFYTRISKGEVAEIKFDDKSEFVFAIMELYQSAWHTLCCVHLLETYGWARFGKPYPSPSHPPGFRRKEWLVRLLPPQAASLLTVIPERQWAELEELFGDLLTELDSQGMLGLDANQKKDMLRYLKSARSRFKQAYSSGELYEEDIQEFWKEFDSE